MNNKKTWQVETPLGTLIAYPSEDPMNPGIFIDLKRPGIDYRLNLSGTECQISEYDGTPAKLVSHIWAQADNEDTTCDKLHTGVEAYFKPKKN